MGDWLLTRNTYCKIVAVWLRVCTTLNQPKTISNLRINIVFSRGQSNTFFKNGLQKHKYPFPGFQLDKQNNSSRGVKKREGFGSGWVDQTHTSLIFSLIQVYYGINCCFTPFYKLSAWNRLMNTRLTTQLNMCNLYSILFHKLHCIYQMTCLKQYGIKLTTRIFYQTVSSSLKRIHYSW